MFAPRNCDWTLIRLNYQTVDFLEIAGCGISKICCFSNVDFWNFSKFNNFLGENVHVSTGYLNLDIVAVAKGNLCNNYVQNSRKQSPRNGVY